MTTLTWKYEYGALQAYQGNLKVAFVVKRDSGEFVYQVDAVHTKWIAKGYGEVKSERSAKAAVERAWATWLEQAGLQPIPGR